MIEKSWNITAEICIVAETAEEAQEILEGRVFVNDIHEGPTDESWNHLKDDSYKEGFIKRCTDKMRRLQER